MNYYPSNYPGGGPAGYYSAYNVNYGAPMSMQQPMLYQQGPPMMQMPPSMQAANVTVNYCWNMDNEYLKMAEQMGLMNKKQEEEEDAQEEEEEQGEEEEQEEVKVVRRKEKKAAQRRIEAAQKMEEKVREDDDFLARIRSTYLKSLQDHLVRSGTLEPTEGTVKPYTQYTSDDPVTVYMASFDGSDLAGKDWDPENDCVFLRDAMKGAGTDEDAIIHVVTSRCNAQRQELKTMFKTAYGRDLIKDIESELSGDFRECVMACFVKPPIFDAWSVKEAIYGLGTDESVLIEILMSRTNAQTQEMKEKYADVVNPCQKTPENQIEQDIEDDTSGYFKKILISAVQGNRRMLKSGRLDDALEDVLSPEDEQPTGQFRINFDRLVDVDKAKRDAQQLFKAGEDRLGTDEETFIRIFGTNEIYQLRRTYDEYVKISQRDVLNTIERETSGDFEKGLYALIMNVKCRPMYFAERLRWCMKGLGTKDHDLIRIIITRSEIDMVQIKKCFLELTKQTLWNWIKHDCSGDYRRILLKLVGRD